MSERNLLAACIASRDAFETVQPYLKKEDVSEQGDIILSSVRDYYQRDPDAQRCDAELLVNAISRGLSNPKHKEMFAQLVASISNQDVSARNVVHDFIEVKREAAGARLATALAAGRSSSDVRPLVEEYARWDTATELESDESEILVGVTATELTESLDLDGLIKIWPKSLNDRLDGGLLRGHHMLIFARPEMGKTMMVINMMAGFAAQGLKTLYVGNEEPIADTQMRVLTRLSGMTKTEIMDDPGFCDQIVAEKGYDLIAFKEAAPGTPYQIQKWIEEVEPDVLIIDQLRNINVNEEHFVQKLEKAATAARNLGKSNNCLVVSVTQAGDSASGKGPLEMGDVDSSNTGIPAQVDVMVGLGATHEDANGFRRIVSLPKNKRSGRHEYFPVRIEPQLSNIRSIT